MTQNVSRIRILKFLWRWRKPLWVKIRKGFSYIHNDLKTQFDIPSTKAAWYKTPRAFLISLFGWQWVEFAAQKGYKRLTVFFINLIPHDNLDHHDLEYIIKKHPSIRAIDCIVAATLTRPQETIETIFEYVAARRFHYYTNLLADHGTSEKAYISLIHWKHTSILERITHKYDPTFLCWVGLAFDCKDLFEHHYPLSNHDKLVGMIDHHFYSMDHDCITFPSDKKEQTFNLLHERQREKLMRCVSNQGDTKKRKM